MSKETTLNQNAEIDYQLLSDNLNTFFKSIKDESHRDEVMDMFDIPDDAPITINSETIKNIDWGEFVRMNIFSHNKSKKENEHAEGSEKLAISIAERNYELAFNMINAFLGSKGIATIAEQEDGFHVENIMNNTIIHPVIISKTDDFYNRPHYGMLIEHDLNNDQKMVIKNGGRLNRYYKRMSTDRLADSYSKSYSIWCGNMVI